jgi:hypothetical protein
MRSDPVLHAGEDDFPPLHAAWLIARSARDAAAAWDRPARPEDVPELADHLHSALRSLSGALLSLTCCIDSTPPQEQELHSFEVSQHVYRASVVTVNAGAGLLRDLPLRGTARTGSAAAETGYELARRTSAAYLSMGPPSSATLAARTAAIEAFLHATGNLGAAASTLASQVPSPHGHRLIAAQASLVKAGEHLLSALERSAARPEPSGRLTLAQRVRDRYPPKRHPHRGPDTSDHPARLAMAGFRFPRRTGRPAARRIRRRPGPPAPAEAPAHALSGAHAMTGSASAARPRTRRSGGFHAQPRNTDPGPRPPRKGDGPSSPSLGGSYGRSRHP